MASDFNPPVPCGAGPACTPCCQPYPAFQSTRPLRGGTSGSVRYHRHEHISIHPPLSGRDFRIRRTRADADISIHPPLSGRDFRIRRTRADADISIHPPLSGRDHRSTARPRCRAHFNPPAPCGAGRRLPVPILAHVISIHPPLAGRDSDLAQKKLCKTSHIAQKVHLPWPY